MSNFKMAYIVICHKNPNQVNRLIGELNHEDVEFFVHIDKKSNLDKGIEIKENVHLVKEPVEVYWGQFSQIECILRSFKDVQEKGHFDFVHVISGQDLPLVSNEEIINFFKNNKGNQFIEKKLLDEFKNYRSLYERLTVYYPKFSIAKSKFSKFLRFTLRKIIKALPMLKRDLTNLPSKLYKGTNWLSITGECMSYILEFTNNSPEYIGFFENTFGGDEIFFHTIILNSDFKSKVINDPKRYVDWEAGPDFPRTLTIDDIDRIRNKRNGAFWGRKFDEDVDREIVDRIITNRLQQEVVK